MGESRPSEEAIALFTNVFGYAPDPEALHAGECWQAERIDAALRRAKAEGMREAAKQARKGATLWSAGMKEREAAALDEFAVWLDARATQIEEGV